MNPDVAKAIPELVRDGILPEDKATLPLRIARGELVSVHQEMRLLFYLAVLTTTSGIGLLVRQNYQQIGPLAVACVIGIAAVSAFVYAARKAPPFSWGEAPTTWIAFDYLLLLGVLLAATDLAFIEVQFTPLGPNWPWHLLFVSLFMAAVAIRYDSRTIASLALSTFAAWRGLSVSLVENPLWRAWDESVRWNALACGALFVLLGRYCVSSRRKPHFEPVAVHLGWLLILGGLVSGGQEPGYKGIAYIALLAATGGSLAWHALRGRRFALFVFGVLGLYLGLTELVFKARLDFTEGLLWVTITSLLLIVLLWKAQKRMKGSL